MAVAAVVLLAACDRGARKDLPQSQQDEVQGNADVYQFPDRFPNAVHRCDGTLGIWVNTDRNMWIIYNDPKCPGAEGDPFVIDNVPGFPQEVSGG